MLAPLAEEEGWDPKAKPPVLTAGAPKVKGAG